MSDAVPQILTKAEACERLRVSLRTLDRLIARGELTTLKIGRRRFVRPSDLEDFLEQRAKAGAA